MRWRATAALSALGSGCDLKLRDNMTICLFFRRKPLVLQAKSHCHGDCLKTPKNALVRHLGAIVTQSRSCCPSGLRFA